MPISALQQSAFVMSGEFSSQVAGIVRRQALYKAETFEGQYGRPMDPAESNLISRVVQNPQNSNFHSVIVADVTWNVTYDTWADDPSGQDGVIQSEVDKWFGLLTGFYPPSVEVQAAQTSVEPEAPASE